MTYVVFPALIWAASGSARPARRCRSRSRPVWRSAITANDVGPFFKQPIDHRTLSTQVYIVVTAMTTLFLAAMVSERERATRQLAGPSAARANRRCRSATGSRATCTTPSRRRCSPRCCTRARPRRRSRRRRAPRRKARARPGGDRRADPSRADRDPQPHLRAGPRPARARARAGPRPAHATRLARGEGPAIEVHAPRRSPRTRPAHRGAGLRHRARGAGQRRQARAGEHGLDQRRGSGRDTWSSRSATTASASSRTWTIQATSASSRCAAAPPRSGRSLSIASAPGRGTVVRIEAPAEADGRPDGG